MRIVVVDANLELHDAEVEESEWEKGGFFVQLDFLPVFVRVGCWDSATTYAGFKTEQEAVDFQARTIGRFPPSEVRQQLEAHVAESRRVLAAGEHPPRQSLGELIEQALETLRSEIKA